MTECRHHRTVDTVEFAQSRKLFVIQDAPQKPPQLVMVHHASVNALFPGPAWVEQDGKRVRIQLLESETAAPADRTPAEENDAEQMCAPRPRLSQDGLSPSQFRRVLLFIGEHLSRNLTPLDLAREAGLSAAYFSQRFKSSTGSSPHQYLLRLRICRAKTLLEKSESPIIDIAAECGFQTQQHFARIFRRLTSSTPTEYRWRWQRSDLDSVEAHSSVYGSTPSFIEARQTL